MKVVISDNGDCNQLTITTEAEGHSVVISWTFPSPHLRLNNKQAEELVACLQMALRSNDMEVGGSSSHTRSRNRGDEAGSFLAGGIVGAMVGAAF